MRRVPPTDEPPGQKRRRHRKHIIGGVVLAMGGLLATMGKWRSLPLRSGFAALDTQIEKFRKLRDSYQAQSKELNHATPTGLSKHGNMPLPQ